VAFNKAYKSVPLYASIGLIGALNLILVLTSTASAAWSNSVNVTGNLGTSIHPGTLRYMMPESWRCM
jgi:hypothetical protein